MQLHELAERARQHARLGQLDQAAPLHEQWLALDPDAVEPLAWLGRTDFAQGRVEQAIERLTRASQRAPTQADLARDLGIACRRARRLDDAERALANAVTTDPADCVARLHLAAVLEALGRGHEALVAYFSAVSTAQGRGEWRGPDSTPPPLRPLLQHAIASIDRGRAALFDRVIAPLRASHGRDALLRVERCLAMYLGDLPTRYADPRQKPTFLYFPDLPSTPWLPRHLFPWYERLEDHWRDIHAELVDVMQDGGELVPFLSNPVNFQGLPFVGGNSEAPRWDAYFFHRHGQRYDEHCARCPATAAALDALPIVSIRDHAPECLYSVLSPGAHILSHRGVTNTRIVTHLPLIVPGNGALRVGGEDREWRQGECFSFDDTYLHEAWNHSDQTRVVLLLDCWNPYMTDVEQLAIADLVAAIGDFSRETRVPLPGDSEHGA